MSSPKIAIKRDGSREPYDLAKIQRQTSWMCEGLNVSQSDLETSIHIPMEEEISTADIAKLIIIEAASKISIEEPDYTYVAARGLLQRIYKTCNNGEITYPHITDYLVKAAYVGRLDPKLVDHEYFDFQAINDAIVPERDKKFDYLGMQTLEDRYLMRHIDEDEGIDTIIELPQFFFMRVAMGVALAEHSRAERTRRAIEYYETYSTKLGLSSTPTLFNAGTTRPQLSSCFGGLFGDSLDGIMDSTKEIAMNSKEAGGNSASLSLIRNRGSRIKSTGGKAGGPIPYLKLLNDTLNAFDQSGKRKGVGSFYIEPWHPDFWDFLDLREPGDERLRAHDIFPSAWVPDLFMERVRANQEWSFFDPKVAPQLHDLHGAAFDTEYLRLEAEGKAHSTCDAETLWFRLLERLYTHGVYWPQWKDEINHRYPNQHVGLVHNSNLCTEIALRNSESISFVCNLTSANASMDELLLVRNPAGGFYWNKMLEKVTRTLVRILDSVITVGYIPHEKGRRFQEEDRAIGLGVMGWVEALYKLGIPYESAEHVVYSNEFFKQMSITAIDESANMAQELGSYKTFEGSLWSKGILPIDTVRKRRIIDEFNLDVETIPEGAPVATFDELREKVKKGMRNSTLMAIAPTATIANILGTTQCTELPWEADYQKKNMGGLFKVIAPTLLHNPHGLPFKAARDVDQMYTVYSAAGRQLWIDQSQSTNAYLNPWLSPTEIGDMMDKYYFASYDYGLKTNYYFYGLSQEETPQQKVAAPEIKGEPMSQEEADRLELAALREQRDFPGDFPQGVEYAYAATQAAPVAGVNSADWTGGKVCDINAGPDCEACQ